MANIPNPFDSLPSFLGWLGSTVFAFIVLQTISSLFGANFRRLAQEKGWDNWFVSGLSYVIPDWETTKRRWWLWLGLGFCGGAATAVLSLETLSSATPPATFVKTELRLQFFGGSHIPEVVGEPTNIYRWYALFSPSMSLHFRDKDGNEIVPPGGHPQFDPTWAVFVVLDKPAAFKQLVWKFSDPNLKGQMVDESQRSFIFLSLTPIPAGELVISGTKLQSIARLGGWRLG
jgi:hypothetical protein